jgi:ATP-dependent protease ClpP protease subunit
MFAALGVHAEAATIRVTTISELDAHPIKAIAIEGEIKEGDDIAFYNVISFHPDIKLIALNSMGGALESAFGIATAIEDYKLNTFATSLCASACTLMWLAGKQRYANANAWIGFHSSQNGLTGKASSYWNGILAAYYEEHGLKNAIKLVNTPPNSMSWINSANARDYGITATWMQSPVRIGNLTCKLDYDPHRGPQMNCQEKRS